MEDWVVQKLKNNLRGDISLDSALLKAASTDSSIFKITPSAVAVPKDIEDLKTLVRNVKGLALDGRQISLTARAAGTCMTGGSLTDSISVDIKPGFNWIGDVDIKNKNIWVGAGTRYKDLQHSLNSHDLLFAPYTSNYEDSVIGGMVGNNSGGEKSLRYGATIDNVMAVKMVCSDGNEYEFGSIDAETFIQKISQDNLEGFIYRELDKILENNNKLLQKARPKVRKNSAGYQLWRVVNKNQDDFNIAKLIVGSQGTLGIITSVKLRLVDKLKHRRMLVITLDNPSKLSDLVKIILRHRPECLEMFDYHTYELAEKYMKQDAVNTEFSKNKNLIVIAQFIEHTKDQTDHYALLCNDELESKNYNVRTVLKDDEAESYWKIRRGSLKMILNHKYNGKRALPFIEDTIINVDHYGKFLKTLESIFAEYNMIFTCTGHIGDGNLQIIPLVDLESNNASEKIYELAARVYSLVFESGGSMSVDHNDGILRTPFLPIMFGNEVMELFAETKFLFDPLNIFNPGKKLGMTLEYAKNHMVLLNNV